MTPSCPIDERRGITSEARNQLLARSDPLFGYYFAPVRGTIVLMARPRKAAVFLRSDFHREFESISLQCRDRAPPTPSRTRLHLQQESSDPAPALSRDARGAPGQAGRPLVQRGSSKTG